MLTPLQAIVHVNQVLTCPIDFSKPVSTLRLEQVRYLSTQYDQITRFKLPAGATIENIAIGTLGRLVFEYLAAAHKRAAQPWYRSRQRAKTSQHVTAN